MYDREKAVAYAHKWAYGRNPAYADFSAMGGDCTNFLSQCLHAGGLPWYTARHRLVLRQPVLPVARLDGRAALLRFYDRAAEKSPLCPGRGSRGYAAGRRHSALL